MFRIVQPIVPLLWIFLAGCLVLPETTYDDAFRGNVEDIRNKAELVALADNPDSRTADGRYYFYEFDRTKEWWYIGIIGTPVQERLTSTSRLVQVLFHFDEAGGLADAELVECEPIDASAACSSDYRAAMWDTMSRTAGEERLNQLREVDEFVAAHIQGWFTAVDSGQREDVRLLLEQGMPVDAEHGGQIAICNAAETGDVAVLELLLDNGAAIDSADVPDGKTPLHIAAARGDLDLSRFLIERGANVHAKDLNGRTPLHYAAVSGTPEVVQSLVASGSKINAKDNENYRPYYLAVDSQNLSVATWFAGQGADPEGPDPVHTVLLRAAELGDVPMLQMLLETGESINGRSAFFGDDSPAGRAAMHRHTEAAKFLISRGADPDKGSPLYWAVMTGNAELVEILLATGADPNRKGSYFDISSGRSYRQTPLEIARKNGHEEIVAKLLSHGAEE